MVKVTRTGQSKAKKLLGKLISEDEFMARKPNKEDVKIYKMIKRELETGQRKDSSLRSLSHLPQKRRRPER